MIATLIVVIGCAAAARADAYIYWADNPQGDGTTIARANLDGTGVDRNFIAGLNDPCGVAVDDQHIYWANRDTNTIGRASLDGTGVDESFIDPAGPGQPCGPAVGGGEIWWASVGLGPGQSRVAHANVDGSDPDQMFIPPQASDPPSTAVSPPLVFWSNLAFGSSDQAVWRAGFDGTPPPASIVDFDGSFAPFWLAADDSHVYVAVTANVIAGVGIARFTHDGAPAGDPILTSPTGGLALHGDKLYWANLFESTISRANPDGSSLEAAFITGAGSPLGLAADGGIPGNDFSIGKLKRNKRKGTAKLTVEVSNPGTVELEGKGLKQSSADAADAGEVQLRVKAKGAKKEKLEDRGKAKLKAEVTFSPTGGNPATETEKLKLVKK